MKTYQEFIQEGKELRRQLAATYYQSSVENSQPKIVDYGDHPPGSPERRKAIEQMMQSQGGKAVRQNVNKLKKQAKKAARKILKNQ